MPFESSPVLTAIAVGVTALLGFALGRWPLAEWARRSMRSERMPRQTVHANVAGAVASEPVPAVAGVARVARVTRGAGGAGIAGVGWVGGVGGVATAVVFGVLALRFGWSPVLPALLAFSACAAVLSIVDLAEKRLPNAVVFPALAGVMALLVPATWAAGTWMPLVGAVIGSVAMFAAYLLLALISPSSMGMGDVKLALVVGALLGWFGISAWLLGLLAAFVVGGVVAIIALALRRVTLRGSIPFGPSMLAGALLAVLFVGP